MKQTIFLCLIVMLSASNCVSIKTPLCVQLTDAYPINEKETVKENASAIDNSFYLYYDPLILPVTLKYTAGKGVSIISKNLADVSLLTPLGVVGTGYTVNTKSSHSINGHPVTGGDFVLALVNHKTEEKSLYKIEGHNKLKVVTAGRTRIKAEAGYVEVDVTEATVEEFTFIDNSRISLVNTTDKVVPFFFGVLDMTSSEGLSTCEIPPHSCVYYPGSSLLNSANELFNAQYFFQVENNDEKNDQFASARCKVSFGDVCQIVLGKDGKTVLLQKKQETAGNNF